MVLALLLVVASGDLNGYQPGITNGRWLQAVQLVLFVATGIGILALGVAEYLRQRDGRTLLLAAWIVGTFLFASCFNWTVSGRNILPMAPAVGILLARRIGPVGGRLTVMPAAALAVSLGLSLWVVAADASLAAAARQTAAEVTARYGTGRKVHFQGHWGWQYYLQKMGAFPIDFRNAALAEGDAMVVPTYGTNIRSLPTSGFYLVESIFPPLLGKVSTMDAVLGAGFYVSQKAALPYAFGPVTPAKYDVFLFFPAEAAPVAR
jgi:hypothetical protein